MTSCWQRLLQRLAQPDDHERARQVEFLKAENTILRSKLPQRIHVTLQERQRLLELGKPLGTALQDLIGIVSPRTFARWVNGETKTATKPAATRGPGRPRTEAEVRELVLRLARETGWGYTRILGELKKLGVTNVSRSTVVNLLKAHGFDPGPKRGEGTWDDFLRRHAETLWATDFFTTNVWTVNGLLQVYVLFFLHLGSRRVHLAGLTAHPDRAWMAQQARNVSMFFGEQAQRPRFLLRDRDSKFVPEFDAVLASDGIEVLRIGPRAPNLNAHAERWVGSVRRECLDHFVVLGEAHLRHLLQEYVRYCNEARPHQGMGNAPLSGPPAPASGQPLSAEEIGCEERLGGLLKQYYRRAA